MIIDNKNHIMFLFRLLNKIKYTEVDEIELSDFIGSPYLTELQKQIEPEFKKYFIDHNERLKEQFENAKLEQIHMDLIIKRVHNWNDSVKQTVKSWNDSQIKDYLIQMIEPLRYDNEQIDYLMTNFKTEIK
ncbi:MAG: hypothetical protein Q8928_00210 [Bacteroidota bacterium]|nr:hypothetical protein [Bacteroidota bacterium]